ncbi:MAG: cell division topological specificity factor MinE [Chloroflexi bacterium]|nr:cell division topological specificity factor MinE [Chloroflexota bacterium]
MSFLDRLFGQETRSKDIAKQRLQLVLIHDRAGIPAALIEVIKDEIIQVISKHLEIDREAMEVNLTIAEQGQNRLVADIPIVHVKEPYGV